MSASSGNNSSARLTAVGVMHSIAEVHALRNSDWLTFANELAELPDADFGRLMEAFELYRKAQKLEKALETGP